MSSERWRLAERIFTEALEVAGDARPAFIARACGGDTALQGEIDALVTAHELHGGALDVPALAGAARELATDLLTLRPGEHVGPYQVVKLIGAGGMGEVYEARDDRLDRRVAIKVLPAWSATDPHRAWRFEQEARAAAALKHPNVVAVFDVGRHGQTPFIVSELLEGQNLRERMSGQPMPVRGAVQIVVQASRGLAAAHAGGVVHRDLKPENVFITRDGQVKILDFGLAKLRPKDTLVDPATATGAGSAEGQLLGTVAYMAPEQVRAEPVDARTDIFAVGAMLYEMLAGAQPFRGRSAIDTLSALLSSEPAPLAEVARSVPADVARIVHRCLEKSPDARFQSAADLAFALESAIADSAAGAGPGVAQGPTTASEPRSEGPSSPRRTFTRRILAGTGLALLAGLALAGAFRLGAPAAPSPPAIRLSLLPPPGTAWGSVPVVSPDTRRLAFVAVDGQQAQLYLQAIDSRTATPVPGTVGAMNPFWSRDSKSLGFMANPPGVLASVDLRVVSEDGAVSPSLWSGLTRGAAFAPDGSFILGPGRRGLIKVSPGGGREEEIARLNREHLEYGHRWPSLLPDGRHLLYFAWASPEEHRGVYVARLDVPSEQQAPRLVLRGDSNAAFVAGDALAPGLLVYEQNRTLSAQRFDDRTMTLSGMSMAIERDVGRLTPDHPAQFSVSPDVIVAGPDVPFAARMTLVDRDGRVDRAIGEGGMAWPRFSPDGRQVLHGRLNVRSGDMDLWLLDLDRDVSSRMTARPGFSGWPAWSPDGRQIAYRYEQYATAQLVVRSLDARDGAERVLDDRRNLRPTDWSPDGRWIVAVGPSTPQPSDAVPPFPGGPRVGLDLWMVPVTGGEPIPLKHSEFNESEARVSPDGRVFVYVSDVSGRPEVYADWFPAGANLTAFKRPAGGPWRVSPGGGDLPVWSRGGRELAYFGTDDRFYTVSVDAGPDGAPRFGRPVPLPVPYGRRFFPPLTGVHYAISDDGERFILSPERGKVTDPMRVIVNWRSLLK